VALPTVTPIAPSRVREPFDPPDWIFELKLDGFRALAYVEGNACRLVSRRGHVYKAFTQLAAAITESLEGHSAILDGEIVCLNVRGEPQFTRLLYRRDVQWFYAFDLIWLDGQDLRGRSMRPVGRVHRRDRPVRASHSAAVLSPTERLLGRPTSRTQDSQLRNAPTGRS